MKMLLYVVTLFGTIITGSIIYFLSGFFKRVGVTDIEEMNESEMIVSQEGILEENFPDELISEKEAKTVNIVGRILFLSAGSIIWIFMGITIGQLAYLLRPSDLMAIIFYLFIYMFCLRFPFGVINKTIKRMYEVELMPEKLVFVILMILGYVVGINCYESIPDFLNWQLWLVK